MKLTIEPAEVFSDVTAAQILRYVSAAGFAILEISDGTYMQCAPAENGEDDFFLEYQTETLDQHFQATDHPISLARVHSAFTSYLAGNSQWQTDFVWEKMNLNPSELEDEDEN